MIQLALRYEHLEIWLRKWTRFGDSEPSHLLFKLLGVFLVYYVIKYLMVNIYGVIFGIKDFMNRLITYDTKAGLPTLILLVLFGYFSIVNIHSTLLVSGIMAGLLSRWHLLRKYYLLQDVFNTVFRIPSIVTILYICIVEFLPWFIII